MPLPSSRHTITKDPTPRPCGVRKKQWFPGWNVRMEMACGSAMLMKTEDILSGKSKRLCLGNYFPHKHLSCEANRCARVRLALAMGSWEGWCSQHAVAPAYRQRAFDSAETAALLPLATMTASPQTGWATSHEKALAPQTAPPQTAPAPMAAPAPQTAPAPMAACPALRPKERWPWPW